MNNTGISYNLILEVLCNESKNKSQFPCKINTVVGQEYFPESFKTIFNKNFYRYGVKSHDSNGKNISILTSVMTAIDKNFLANTSNEQEEIVNKVRLYLIECLEIKSNLKKWGYNKIGLTRDILVERIKLNDFDNFLIQLICDVFKINIVTFNVLNEKIYIFSHDFYERINVFYPSIFLATDGKIYEPIAYKDRKDFNNNDNGLIDKILSAGNINMPQIGELKKDKLVNNDFKDILKRMFTIPEETVPKSINENSPNNEDLKFKYKGYTKSKFLKMKKDELLDICKELDFSMGTLQNENKNRIVEKILFNL